VDWDIESVLIRDLDEATVGAGVAGMEFRATITDTPSGLPHPDGMQRIVNAAHKRDIARRNLVIAHDRLINYLERGIVPEDLKRSG
jgi:hypothetical protein